MPLSFPFNGRVRCKFFPSGWRLLPYDHGLDYDISLLCEDSIYQPIKQVELHIFIGAIVGKNSSLKASELYIINSIRQVAVVVL